MSEPKMQVMPRHMQDGIYILDIQGEVNAAAEQPLMDAYTRVTDQGAKVIVLNFAGLEYMNSTGIGVLVTLLIRATRARQRMLAYGLSSHYRQIFEMTRLNEAISLYDDEASALISARPLRAG